MSMDLSWKNKADDEEAEAEETFIAIKAALEALEEIEEAEAQLEDGRNRRDLSWGQCGPRRWLRLLLQLRLDESYRRE